MAASDTRRLNEIYLKNFFTRMKRDVRAGGDQGQFAGLLPDSPPGRGLKRVAVLAAEEPTIGTGPKRLMCSRSRITSSGGTGTRRAGRRPREVVLNRPLLRPFRPQCS